MPVLFVLLANLVSLAIVVGGIVRSGERAQVLLYAFILMLKLPSSGWAVLAPLLAFRFLYDVTTGIQAARRQSPDVR